MLARAQSTMVAPQTARAQTATANLRRKAIMGATESHAPPQPINVVQRGARPSSSRVPLVGATEAHMPPVRTHGLRSM